MTCTVWHFVVPSISVDNFSFVAASMLSFFLQKNKNNVEASSGFLKVPYPNMFEIDLTLHDFHLCSSLAETPSTQRHDFDVQPASKHVDPPGAGGYPVATEGSQRANLGYPYSQQIFPI